MPAVFLFHSRSSSFSHVSGSFDKLAQRHEGRYWSNNPLNFWRGGGGVLCYNVGLLFWKKNSTLPHIPMRRYTCLQSKTHTRHSHSGVSGYATILICFINTHGYTHKNTQLHAHKIRSACAGRATKASLPRGGGDDCVCLCVFNG